MNGSTSLSAFLAGEEDSSAVVQFSHVGPEDKPVFPFELTTAPNPGQRAVTLAADRMEQILDALKVTARPAATMPSAPGFGTFSVDVRRGRQTWNGWITPDAARAVLGLAISLAPDDGARTMLRETLNRL